MIKKFFLFCLLCAIIPAIDGFSQATISSDGPVFYLNPNGGTPKTDYRRGSYVGEHFFGEEVGALQNTFEMTYTYFMPGDGAYAVETKMIFKPEIYNTTKKIISTYQKEVKKKRLPYTMAEAKAKALLTRVNLLANYQTDDVEKFLKKEKDLESAANYLLELKLAPLN